jgi:hypothetical protein
MTGRIDFDSWRYHTTFSPAQYGRDVEGDGTEMQLSMSFGVTIRGSFE